MKIMQVLVLMSVCVTVAAAEPVDVYVGTLAKSSEKSLTLERKTGILSVGFVADASVLNELKGLGVGMEVRVTFGTTTVPGEARTTNKLLSIRHCVDDDAECDADRQREEAERAARRLASEARDHEQEICFAAMRVTLAKDDRYIIDHNEDDELSDEMDARHVALVGKQRECSNALLGRHQRAYLEACELHRCAQDIAGGCDHLAGQEISDAAIEHAVETCEDL